MFTTGSYSKILRQPSFISYLTTIFLGAFNDNMFKTIVMLLALEQNQAGKVDMYFISAQLVFILPYLLFSGYAGFLADKFAKHKVLIYTKSVEILTMLLALYYLPSINKTMLVVTLFLLSAQSVFFSPAKYGILPEIFEEAELSRANGLLELLTFIAIIIGTAAGGLLMDFLGNQRLVIGLILTAIAVAGTLCSLGIAKVAPSGSHVKFHTNPFHEVWLGIRSFFKNRDIVLVIFGISFFFCIALALMTNLMVYGKQTFHLSDLSISLLTAVVAVGIGTGSMVAGWLSGDKIEHGLIPMGTLGMTFGCFWVGDASSVLSAHLALFTTGFMAGLFIVPLNAMLQELPEKQEKGRLIATNNFFNGVAMIIAVLMLWLLQVQLNWYPATIMRFLGILLAGFTAISIITSPRFFIRLLLWIVLHIFYRVHVIGKPNIPYKGPALIVANHVSFIDGLIISMALPRFVRFLVDRSFYDNIIFHWLFRLIRAIPVEAGNASQVKTGLEAARQALLDGHVVCIFAEGSLTRTGNLLPFRRGLERILEGINAPIIPVHLDQLWESVFSYSRGRAFLKLPQQFPAEIVVTLGETMPANSKAWQVRQAVQTLAAESCLGGMTKPHHLAVEFLRAARMRPLKICVRDNQRLKVTYGKLSTEALLLARHLTRKHRNETRIGIYMPNCYAGIILILAAAIANKTVVLLPTTATTPMDLTAIIKQLGLKTVYTLPDHNTAANIEPEYLQHFNIAECMFTPIQYWLARLAKYGLPLNWVAKIYGQLSTNTLQNEIAIVFTNRPTQPMRGIALGEEEIFNNIAGLKQILRLKSKDRFAALLPLSSAFSYVCCIWLPIFLGAGIVPHRDPHKVRDVGKHIHKSKVSVLLNVPAMYQEYYKQFSAHTLAFVRYAVIGGDKISNDFARDFEDKFDIKLLQGYGEPELGPVVSVNMPNVRSAGILQRGAKFGSIGHPLPNIAVRIVAPTTGELLGVNAYGYLQIKSPSLMLGYVSGHGENKLPLTTDEWYTTNMLATIDEDGFIFFAEDTNGNVTA